jgi:hypothetical protein
MKGFNRALPMAPAGISGFGDPIPEPLIRLSYASCTAKSSVTGRERIRTRPRRPQLRQIHHAREVAFPERLRRREVTPFTPAIQRVIER